VVSFAGEWQGEGRRATATVRLTFDPSPLIKWQIDLETQGTDLRVELILETAVQGQIWAGMPFDVVRRAAADSDLLPRELSGELAAVLLGQRELNVVTTFPFHDFVALEGEGNTAVILAKGLHAYRADGQGKVVLPLQRAVEWVTKAELHHRVGDAGPFFYVPDARGERLVRHEVAVAIGPLAVDSLALHHLNTAYQNPALIVRAGRAAGTQTTWHWFEEAVALSSLAIHDNAILARFYNPTTKSLALSHPYQQTDTPGNPLGERAVLRPKQIMTVRLPDSIPPAQATAPSSAAGLVTLLTFPPWRVGESTTLPDPAILAQLAEKIATLEDQLAEIEAQLSDAAGASAGIEQLRLQHRFYILKRECVEFQLSLLLNQRRLAEPARLRYDYLYQPDEEVARVGVSLNRLRIKRRIFDYVVQAL
jgi:alpha-mannosidase